ncbi:hypothetical protein WQ54_09460 [Bacillus sp. SA1-12]|uniref:YesL family protein n=1 Tax=Bacillus sp. SA1-12 TaxID=1455638 RepID=UPI0006254F85|nr:DUF624 domain-containing protein [Bacillus sp. SA1-12]KKI92393.1 hypothetical protein WQ54_09460 [Bacillus sp. SA1-12]
MVRIDGKLYRICLWIYSFFLLNLLFLVSCLAIITIFPAVAALFGVVREWVNKKEPPIFQTYVRLFKENLKQSFSVGLSITIIVFVLLGDFYLLTIFDTSMNLLIFSSVSFISFFFIVTVFYIFPLMVNSPYTFKELFITACKFGLYRFSLTVANFIILLCWLYLSITYSFFLVFFFFSVSAFITYWFANLKFLKLTSETKAIPSPNLAFSRFVASKRKDISAVEGVKG